MSNNGKGSNNGKLIGYYMIEVETKDLDCSKECTCVAAFLSKPCSGINTSLALHHTLQDGRFGQRSSSKLST